MYNYRAIGCLVLYQAPCCSCCCRAVPELFSASAASAAANELQSALGERGISPLRVAARVCAALSTAEVPSSGLEDEFRKKHSSTFQGTGAGRAFSSSTDLFFWSNWGREDSSLPLSMCLSGDKNQASISRWLSGGVLLFQKQSFILLEGSLCCLLLS